MTQEHKVLIAGALVALLPVDVSAQEGRGTVGRTANQTLRSGRAHHETRSEQARALRAVLANYDVIRKDPAEIESRVRGFDEPLELKLGGSTYLFRMELRDLRSPRYRAEETGQDGTRRLLPEEPVATFRATSIGPEQFQGRFTITKDSFEGVVFTPENWTFIEPLTRFTDTAEKDELVVYRASDIKPGQLWRCGVAHQVDRNRDRLDQKIPVAANATYTVELATEADYEYTRSKGGVSSANREIRSLLNLIEGVYQQELNLNLTISYQHGWSTRSDPYDPEDASDLLDQFQDYWNDNYYFTEDYDIAFLWTDNEDLDIGGIAYVGSVCSSRTYAYALARDQGSRPSNVNIFAHEIGHGFDAVHPDEEEPPVSSCDGTIMQSGWEPFPLLTFCRFSRNEISSYVSENNSCLQADAATITLKPPGDFRAEALGPNNVLLRWQGDSLYTDGYRLEWRPPGQEWLLKYWLPAFRVFLIDGEVAPSSTYEYRMYAYSNQDNVKSSPWANVTVTTPPRVEAPGPVSLERWVIPTSANAPGRFGGVYKTMVVLVNASSSEDVEIEARLYGSSGLIDLETLTLQANYYWVRNDFLGSVFGYKGGGAIELTGNRPFYVASVEVYIESSGGKNTTVVTNQPLPLSPYSGAAASFGMTVNDYTRTNIGVFNSSERRQTVTAKVYSGQRGDDPETIRFGLRPKAWLQKSISRRVDGGYIVWDIPQEAYLWAVEVDNDSNDGTLTFPIQ